MIDDARTIFPTAAESTLVEGVRRLQQSSTTVGIVAARLLAVGRRVLLGRAGHGVLPHLPPAVPLLGAPEAVRLRDARRRAGLHRRERGRADRAVAAGLGRAATCRSASATRATSSTGRRSALGLVDPLRRAVHHLRGGAQGRDPVVAACGRARSARRSPWASSTSRSRSTCRTSRRCGSARSAVFVLIALVWFYVLALIVLAGAVVNELRFERVRPSAGTAASPAPRAATSRPAAPAPIPAARARAGRSDGGGGREVS